MAVLRTYIVTSSLPVVVDDAGKTTVYNPGDVFEELDSNVSVTRLLALGRIVPFVGQPVSGPMVISQGQPGPAGPTGPAGTGESNTNSNAGGDVGLSLTKVGSDLPLRGLTAGAGVSLTPTPIDVIISVTAGGENLDQTLTAGNLTGGNDILVTGGDQIVGTQTILDPGVSLDTDANEVIAAINELKAQVALISQVFS